MDAKFPSEWYRGGSAIVLKKNPREKVAFALQTNYGRFTECSVESPGQGFGGEDAQRVDFSYE